MHSSCPLHSNKQCNTGKENDLFLLNQYQYTVLNSLWVTKDGLCVQKWWLPMNFCTSRKWYTINMANFIVICAQGTDFIFNAFDSAGDRFLEIHLERWDACSHFISNTLFAKYQPMLNSKLERLKKNNSLSQDSKRPTCSKEPVSFSRKFKESQDLQSNASCGIARFSRISSYQSSYKIRLTVQSVDFFYNYVEIEAYWFNCPCGMLRVCRSSNEQFSYQIINVSIICKWKTFFFPQKPG